MEELFQRERVALATPAPTSPRSLLLLGSLVAFVLLGAVEGAPLEILLLLAGVLALHEAGHYVAMQRFGYREVRIFFVPFFGAAVTARRSNVEAWKQGVALLLGPLPGLVLALALLLLARGGPIERHVGPAILLLTWVNALNLLPLGGLDGARLFQRVVFSRQRHLEVIFLAVAGGMMLAIALRWHLWVLAIFAAAGVAAIPRRHQVLALAHSLCRRGLMVEVDLAAADETQLRPLFRAAYDVLPGAQRLRERVIATFMEELADASRRAPTWPATVVLLTGWLFGVLIAVMLAAMLVG